MGKGKEQKWKDKQIIIISQVFAHADPLAQIPPAPHVTSSTKPSPAAPIRAAPTFLTSTRDCFMGLNSSSCLIATLFFTMSSQFFPLKGWSTFPHHSTLSLVKAKANSIRWKWWYANSKTSCASPTAMKRACQGQPTSPKKRKKLPWPSPQRSLAQISQLLDVWVK